MNEDTTNLLLSLLPKVHRQDVSGVIHRLPQSDRFHDFVSQCRDTIRKELRTQKDVEDFRDVFCEIEFAAWIAKFATGLRYQLATPNGKGIDFLVEFEQFGNVGVEVKGIFPPKRVCEKQVTMIAIGVRFEFLVNLLKFILLEQLAYKQGLQYLASKSRFPANSSPNCSHNRQKSCWVKAA